MNRFLFFFSVAFSVSAAFAAPFDAYTFGLLGDIHYDADYLHTPDAFYVTAPGYLDAWKTNELPALATCARIFETEPRVAFAVQTGDLVSGGSGSLVLQKQMLTEAWNAVRPIFSRCGPFHAVNGNHETYDFDKPDTYAYPAFAETIQVFNGRELGLDRPVGKHYWFRKGPDLFVCYDSNADEYAFVEEAFDANPDTRWVFVVGHIPTIAPVPGGIEIDNPDGGYFMEFKDRFLKLLQSRNAILLCGDTHFTGFLDYVTEAGRFSQIMGVVVRCGKHRVRASSADDFPCSRKPSARQRHLKPGIIRYSLRRGSGCWRIAVDEARVTAEWYSLENPGAVAERVVVRGLEVECRPLRIVWPEGPLSADRTLCRVEGTADVTGTWTCEATAGWRIADFDPAAGTFALVHPTTPVLARTNVVVRISAADGTGRIVANGYAERPHRDPIEVPFRKTECGFRPEGTNGLSYAVTWNGEGLRWNVSGVGVPFVENLDRPVRIPSDWPEGSRLEFFFDPLHRKAFSLSREEIQYVFFPIADGRVRTLSVRYPVPPERGVERAAFMKAQTSSVRDVWTSDVAGVTGSWKREGTDGFTMSVFLPWRAVAPASDPAFAPIAGSYIGCEAAWGDFSLVNGGEKIWDDPSMWADLHFAGSGERRP